MKNTYELKKELIFVILFWIIVWSSGLYMYLEGERVPNLSILICGFIGYNIISDIFKKNVINSKNNIIKEWNFMIKLQINEWKKFQNKLKKILVLLVWNNTILQQWKKTIISKIIENKVINLLKLVNKNKINNIFNKKLNIIFYYELIFKKLYKNYIILTLIKYNNKLLQIVLNNKLSNTINLDIILIKLYK